MTQCAHLCNLQSLTHCHCTPVALACFNANVGKQNYHCYADGAASWVLYDNEKVHQSDWEAVKEVEGSMWVYQRREPRQQLLPFATTAEPEPSPAPAESFATTAVPQPPLGPAESPASDASTETESPGFCAPHVHLSSAPETSSPDLVHASSTSQQADRQQVERHQSLYHPTVSPCPVYNLTARVSSRVAMVSQCHVLMQAQHQPKSRVVLNFVSCTFLVIALLHSNTIYSGCRV